MGIVPSLPENTPLDQYVSTAGQTDFVFTFMIFETENIKVYVNSILKTENVDYVVKKADNSVIDPINDLPMSGGKIVFNSGLALNDAVSISRDIDIERISGFSTAGDFRANTVNGEYTKLFAIQQEFKRDLDRSVRLNEYDAEGGSTLLPENRAGKYLAFDQSSNLIVSSGTVGQSLVVSSFIETLLDDTTAAAARATLEVQENVITNRGDLIRGSSSNAQERLALGAANTILTSNGTDVVWGAPPLSLSGMQVFTSSGTWTKPAGVSTVIVEVQGGGGGGGAATTDYTVGAGGGGGGYSRKLITSGLGASETVTIGNGGLGGGAGGGNTGGTSSFGAHCSATGGTGGAGNGGAFSSGGVGSSGDANLSGGSGDQGGNYGTAFTNFGAGGGTFFGSGGRAGAAGGGGGAGVCPGAGGGAGHRSTGTNRAGANGAAGIVIVYEYS